jgi:hypothetical protein
MADHLAEQAALGRLAEDRRTRTPAGDVDCARCEARGFRTFPVTASDGTTSEHFEWCRICEHTGRVALVQSTRGFFAVARSHVEAFVAGTRDDGDEDAVFLGPDAPAGHRYPAAGDRHED